MPRDEDETIIVDNLDQAMEEVHMDITNFFRELGQEVGHAMAERARELAPVDTGALQQSIRGGSFMRDRDTVIAWATAGPPFYVRFQENGFTQRDGQWNPGNPFLRPAFYEITDGINYGQIQNSLQEALPKFKRLPKDPPPPKDSEPTGERRRKPSSHKRKPISDRAEPSPRAGARDTGVLHGPISPTQRALQEMMINAFGVTAQQALNFVLEQERERRSR